MKFETLCEKVIKEGKVVGKLLVKNTKTNKKYKWDIDKVAGKYMISTKTVNYPWHKKGYKSFDDVKKAVDGKFDFEVLGIE